MHAKLTDLIESNPLGLIDCLLSFTCVYIRSFRFLDNVAAAQILNQTYIKVPLLAQSKFLREKKTLCIIIICS